MKKQTKAMKITLPQRGEGVKAILRIKMRPTEERIRQRAYEIHQARGGAPGQELDDWLQAERELTQECDAESAEVGEGGIPVEGKGGKEGDENAKPTAASLLAIGAILLALVMLTGCASTRNEAPPTAMDLLYQMNQRGRM